MTTYHVQKLASFLLIILLSTQLYGQQANEASDIHEQIQNQTATIFDELVALRRDFHKHPEIAEEESRTAQKITDYLLSLGLEVKTNVGGHGVVGILHGSKKGKKVAWRADIDALASNLPDVVDFQSENEGVRHICGHDVHATVALGMANVLSKQRAHFAGTVYFIFQPSEENWKGARAMMDDGLFSIINPDEIYAAHISPMPAGLVASKPGYLYADYKQVNVTFKTGIEEEQLIADVKEIISNLQNVSEESEFWDTKNLMDPNIGIGNPKTIFKNYITVEDKFLVSKEDEQITISGFVSASNEQLIHNIPDILKNKIEESTYSESLLSIDYASKSFAYSNDRGNVNNNKQLVTESIQSIAKEYGPSSAIQLYGVIPDGRGDDFAYFQKDIPGVYFFLGGSNFEKGVIAMPHSPNFAVDETCIQTGVNYFSSMIIEQLRKE